MLNTNANEGEFQEFLRISATEFMGLPAGRAPELRLVTRCRAIKIHVLDAKPAALLFFQKIMKREPNRFRALNRAFHEAQPQLDGNGWVVTRFAGAAYLSLCLRDEIYVRLIPPALTPQALDLAKRLNRFLDCYGAADNPQRASSAMPLSLARSLCYQIA